LKITKLCNYFFPDNELNAQAFLGRIFKNQSEHLFFKIFEILNPIPLQSLRPTLLTLGVRADVQPKSSISIGAKVEIRPKGFYTRSQG
jgi:hypothetical protein